MATPDLPSTSYVTNLFVCEICGKEFRAKDIYLRHLDVHDKPCRICGNKFTCSRTRNLHEKQCRQVITSSNFSRDFQTSLQCQTAIGNRFLIFDVQPSNHPDFVDSLISSLETVQKTLEELLRSMPSVKFYIIFEALLRKKIHGEEKEFGFYSNTHSLLLNSDIDDLIQRCKEKIHKSMDEFLRRGSGWIVEKFTHICLHVTEFRPCAGGTYLDLPKSLRGKQTVQADQARKVTSTSY